MRSLIIKNIPGEGPGTIEDHLRDAGIPYEIVELSRGARPPDVERYSHIIVMGGPMAVYEMDRHSFLTDETRLIERAIKGYKHVLGVCLGAQMIAHVLGGRVYLGGQKEIGWHEVSLTGEGMKDRCMSGLSIDGRNAAQVFQWHGDTFDLPAGAVLLASSNIYPNQAFRYKDRVYALQFHIEVTPRIVREWLEHEPGIDFPAINAESERMFTSYYARARAFYREFFGQSSG